MKYMGSKARISKDISLMINKSISENNIENYIEPFVGGANMIENIICPNRYGLDSNRYLIAMWNALQSDWNPPETISKEEYKIIRDNKDNYSDELVAFAGFVATYNAKWFGGYAGIVTTKINTQRNYYDEARRNILKQLPRVKNVKFHHKKFQEMDLSKTKNCFIYCDPPYKNATEYKDEFNHDEFWEWVRNISKNNIVYVSEYNAPEDFSCIWKKEITTTLDKNSRKKDVEKLFVSNKKENL